MYIRCRVKITWKLVIQMACPLPPRFIGSNIACVLPARKQICLNISCSAGTVHVVCILTLRTCVCSGPRVSRQCDWTGRTKYQTARHHLLGGGGWRGEAAVAPRTATSVINLFGGGYEFLVVFYTFFEANRRFTLKIHCHVRVSECKGICFDGIRPAAPTANPW